VTPQDEARVPKPQDEARPPEPPFDPGFPLPDPVAVTGCDVCAQYVKAIKGRRRAGDQSAISDYRVLMRRHIDSVHG